MKEIWKPVLDYEGLYEVSNLGNIRSLEHVSINTKNVKQIFKSMTLKPYFNNKGYLNVSLCKNGKRSTLKLHRLVGIAFIPNNDNKPTINHIDGIKTHNYVDNLEWNTYAENNQHAYDNKLKISYGLTIIQYDLNDIKINEFNSILESQKQTNIGHMSIRRCCRNEQKTAGKYKWKFK
jgi:hypothetical protein